MGKVEPIIPETGNGLHTAFIAERRGRLTSSDAPSNWRRSARYFGESTNQMFHQCIL